MRNIATQLISLMAAIAALAMPPASAQDPGPYTDPDVSWISISGTVDAVETDQFALDYGQGLLTVEMDDVDRNAAGYTLAPGDKVTASGIVGDEFLGTTTLEASSLYIEKLGTTFYASGVEEDRPIVATTPVAVSETTLRGLVTEVNPGNNEFRVDTGRREITVDVSAMPYDPLSADSFQQIEEGQYVSVTADADKALFEESEIETHAVMSLGG